MNKELSKPEPSVESKSMTAKQPKTAGEQSPIRNGVDYEFNSDTHELIGGDPEAFRARQVKETAAQLAEAARLKEAEVEAYLKRHQPPTEKFPNL